LPMPTPSPEKYPPSEPLTSDYAADPEMSELVAMFVKELPARLEAIRAALRDADAGSVGRLVHQLRGSGSGYGFPSITATAAEAERTLRDSGLAAAEASVRDLLTLCSRACVR
jgi:HPt (histidine-containing phosphotransfer) domain-containing protein